LNTDLEAIQREVDQRFKDGKTKGETEIEITSRLILLERQKHCALCVMQWKRFLEVQLTLSTLQQKHPVRPRTSSNGESHSTKLGSVSNDGQRCVAQAVVLLVLTSIIRLREFVLICHLYRG